MTVPVFFSSFSAHKRAAVYRNALAARSSLRAGSFFIALFEIEALVEDGAGGEEEGRALEQLQTDADAER